jgi:hypothetical protein
MRLALLYLSLVGLPILGVLGILRLGEALMPPVSIGGAWNIEVNPRDVDDSACGDLLSAPVPPFLTISQSGPHLRLSLNNHERTTFVGEIHGGTVTADETRSTTVAEANAAEVDPAAAHIEASVDRQAEPSRLRGILTTTHCSQRTEISFSAVRQPDQGQ